MRIPLVLALLLALPALAADPDAARTAYQRGQNEYNLGNYAEAAKDFEETYRLKPVPALLFNIAQCYRFLGNLDKAAQTYRAYLRTAPPTDRNIELGKDLLAQVEKAINQKKNAEAAQPHGLAPGPPPEALPKPPEKPAPTKTEAPPMVTQPQPLPPPAAPPKSRTLVWIGTGATVLALGASTIFGMQASKTSSDMQSGFHTRAELDAANESAKSSAGKANLFLIGGLVFGAVTAAAFIFEF